jgi:hypothetical protein
MGDMSEALPLLLDGQVEAVLMPILSDNADHLQMQRVPPRNLYLKDGAAVLIGRPFPLFIVPEQHEFHER